MASARAAMRTRSTLYSRSPRGLEHSGRPLNGGLTIMTMVLGGARFVVGIYVPLVEEGEGKQNAANPDAGQGGAPGVYGRLPVGVRRVGG